MCRLLLITILMRIVVGPKPVSEKEKERMYFLLHALQFLRLLVSCRVQ